MSEGLKAAYIENRKAVYGEWEQVFLDMDEGSVKVAEENPFLAQTGKISIYGAIAGDYLENRQMNIGTMDETAWKLGRLEMKEGRLPENEHEIVMEYSTLRSLGYEEMLGKEITLDITPALSILDQGESKSYSYTLCGILKDYQINWEICNRQRFPTGIVTQEGGNRIGSVQDMHMLVKAKEGSESVYKDLKDSEEFTCGMDDNVEQDKLSDVSLPYADWWCVDLYPVSYGIAFDYLKRTVLEVPGCTWNEKRADVPDYFLGSSSVWCRSCYCWKSCRDWDLPAGYPCF